MTSLMEIDPLFNTLLNQGKSFLNIQKDYKYMVDPHLKLIEQTTSPKLGSLIENFSGNFTDDTNKVAAEVAAINDDGAKTAATAAFTNAINQYNANLKTYQAQALTPGSVTNYPPSGKNTAGTKFAAMNAMYTQLADLNNMITAKLTRRTSGGSKGYDYQAGSGQAGAGDQPQLLEQRAKILGPVQTALSAQRGTYDAHVRDLNTLIGEGADTEIRAKSAYYKYIVWLIVSITLISYTIKYASS